MLRLINFSFSSCTSHEVWVSRAIASIFSSFIGWFYLYLAWSYFFFILFVGMNKICELLKAPFGNSSFLVITTDVSFIKTLFLAYSSTRMFSFLSRFFYPFFPPWPLAKNLLFFLFFGLIMFILEYKYLLQKKIPRWWNSLW